ncbi:B12-binding domain-containing radical SAM protein [Anaerosacchariphilus polymeriproducens]|uniref:Radical SAM protein n=1 Tax=Anaerosacchariphilus polymeriproducens TaxID=1812858 RepID=A0A371AT10_9FIRM|nr:radical SAM protein [Anaerosacchariphilus polymeriproducens]RDU22714.1 radical SAM protein [Anaerosacchariphilus polymeriproducens]
MNICNIDIIFLSPEVSFSKIVSRPHPGIAYLQSYLRFNGFNTEHLLHEEPLALYEYFDLLLTYNTNNYAFSVTDDTLEVTISIIHEIRNNKPECTIIIGGAIAKEESADYLLKNDICDFVVIGEGEEPLKKLLIFLKCNNKFRLNEKIPGIASFDKEKNNIVFEPNNEVLDINSYPSPILTGVVPERMMTKIGVFSSRGCYHKCIYCSFSTTSEWRVRFYSEERFLAELTKVARVAKKYGSLEPIPIWDDAFTLNQERAKRILKKIISMKLGVKFWIQTRIDKLDSELIRLMKQAGIDHVGIGLESASPKILKKIRKIRLDNFDEESLKVEMDYIEKFRWFAECAQAYGLEYTINIILGLPGETFEDGIKTMELVRELRPKYYFHNIIRLYTGVPLTRDYMSYGYKIEAPNINHNENSAYPVNAKVKEYPYNVKGIPPLPNRMYLNFMETSLKGLNERNDSVIIFEGKSSENLNVQNKHFKGKYVLFYHENSENQHHILSSDYIIRTVNDFTCSKSRIEKSNIKEIELRYVYKLFNELIHNYMSYEYTRYAELADSMLILKTETRDDYSFYTKILERIKHGGEIKLPRNILGVQYMNVFIKDSCKWTADCPFRKNGRMVIDSEYNIKTCSAGTILGSLEEPVNIITHRYDERYVMMENERGCKHCEANGSCSKCISIPDEFVGEYCEIQKSKHKPQKLIEMIIDAYKQVMDPLNLDEYMSDNNYIYLPPEKNDANFAFILKLSCQYYCVFEKNGELKMFEIPSVLEKLIKHYWIHENKSLLTAFINMDNYLKNEDVEELLNAILYLDQYRRNL